MKNLDEKHELTRYLLYAFKELPVLEYKFHPTRRWRLDFAFLHKKVAIEYEGMPFMGKSRHTTISGFTGDCEKYNELAIMGWTLLRVNAPLLRSGVAYAQIDQIMHGKEVKS